MAQNNNSRNQRRRRRKLLPVLGYVVIALALAWFFESRATSTVIFVRHTDTDLAAVAELDPPLNERGKLRAELLADTLQDIDVIAGFDAIYTSEHRSAQETAAPLADRLDLAVQVEDPYDVEPFADRIRREHRGKIVLVVTPAEAIAPSIAALSGSKNVPDMRGDEYHNIYIVTIPRFGKVKTLRLHYGLPWPQSGQLTPSASHFSDSL